MPWTAPRTWVAGEVVTAAMLNTHIRDNMKALSDPWTAYTPTVTGFTVGNGTVAAAYRQIGKTFDFRFRLIAGSTTVAAGVLTLTTPVPMIAAMSTAITWFARDVSASAVFSGNGDGGGAGFNLRGTNPFTWATGDFIGCSGTAEAA